MPPNRHGYKIATNHAAGSRKIAFLQKDACFLEHVLDLRDSRKSDLAILKVAGAPEIGHGDVKKLKSLEKDDRHGDGEKKKRRRREKGERR
jgi:hypothetical protein